MYLFLSISMIVWTSRLDAAEINKIQENGIIEQALSGSLIQNLIARVELLEERDRNNQRDVAHMKEELTEQKKEITQLQKTNAEQDHLITELLLSLHGDGAARNPNTENAMESRKPPSLQERLNPQNRIRRANRGETVTFSAGLTQSLLHIGQNQNVLFDRVDVNKGNGYNPQHGVFTAPVAGTYVFHASILAYNNREVWCNMVVNGHNKWAIYARGTDNRHDQGSQVIIVQLKAGDDVSVQNQADDDAIYGGGNIYTTFSGFLLEQNLTDHSSVVG